MTFGLGSLVLGLWFEHEGETQRPKTKDPRPDEESGLTLHGRRFLLFLALCEIRIVLSRCSNQHCE
jgi:hypothetical protein